MLNSNCKILLLLTVTIVNCEPPITVSPSCAPSNPQIENGDVILNQNHQKQIATATVTCHENYTLIGQNLVLLQCVSNQWKFVYGQEFPKCERRCPPPPFLEHGETGLEKQYVDLYKPSNTYSEGTIARYTCKDGYQLEPATEASRICQKGSWTGKNLFCKASDEMSYCTRPPMVENGFMEPSEYAPISVGQEIVYQCLSGYRMVGSERIRCSNDGVWVPDVPSCHKESDFFPTSECASRPLLNPKLHSRIEITSISSDAVEVGCQVNYQNYLALCQTSKFYCKHGKWVGMYPRCVEARTCKPPPTIAYAVAVNHNFDTTYTDGIPFYPINEQMRYECLKGYVIDGSAVITCQPNGCWEPTEFWPTCVRTKESFFIELNDINAILISSAIGAGVLGILLFACLLAACKKRRALTRAVSALPATSGGGATEIVNDHAVLLQHPDRLALIAFADGVQNSQATSLPSYDEATRDGRSTLIQVSRLQIQRPHWPNLTVCRTSARTRGSPNNNDATSGNHRHGSFASHTPSMRSNGESMGSTETVTISEGSTNVTLDTASSHSALSQNSQNPSCRVHCGSLASFDGCSVANNTEGIPLLEENELEDANLADNVSCQMSTHSAN
ncbi:unnamed protein product [Ceutorhynchus assimilis]|uniref:Sushi domain-containing protein n=1 Tax=Ceutorhynchus assimilis TaxID=467358 RepID=A0A9N9MLK8_9CUCU|nr:unnamed protein product [Ceutorhynchus assimilis]